jgi:hypothetical protein
MSARTRLLWFALLGLILLIAGVLPVVVVQHARNNHAAPGTPAFPQAGGSATGNALEIAADTPRAQPWLIVIDSGSRLAVPAASASLRITEMPTDDNQPVPDPDSLKRPLDAPELTRWLAARQLLARRLFILSPTGDNALARPGIVGPAYQDLTTLPGGLQPGDLVIYREGIYSSSLQFPPKNFQANVEAPLLLLAWPGEHARVASPALMPDSSAQYWKIIGLEWSALANQGAKR